MADPVKIWLTPAIFKRIQARAAANHPFWVSLKSRIDQPASWDIRPLAYCIGYQASGNTVYADRAIQLANTWASQGVDAITGDSGYPCRQVIPELAVTYSLCYDRLTASQRDNFRQSLEAQANWVWPETNPSRQGQWGVGWASSNYFLGFGMTMLAGLALKNDGTGQKFIDQAVVRHKAKVLPRMSKEWSGGMLEEGAGYGLSGSLMWLAYQLNAYQTATGDATSLVAPNWYSSLLRAFIHITTPDRKRLFPSGDQARVSSAPISDYSLAAVLAMMDSLSAEDAGMARFWVDQVYPTRDKIGWTAWMPLLWYRDDVAPIDYTKKLATFYSMPGRGVVSSRSSWATDAVQVVAAGGGVIEDAHETQTGTFDIWAGTEWLAGRTLVWSHDGTEHFSPDLSTVILNNTKQTPKSDCRVLLSQDTQQATTWVADLTAAYPDLLNSWRRHLLFVKPNWVIVLDNIETKSAGTEKKWLLHTKNAPTQTGKTVRAVAGNNCLFSTTLLPADASVTREQLSTGSWRTNVKSSGAAHTFFLHALEVAPSSQSQATPVTISQNGTTVSLKLGSVTVEVLLDATVPALKLAGSVPPPPPPPGNQPPIANAGGPYQAAVGKALIFDGGKSKDNDGRIVSYQWQLGDGTAGTGMQFIHSYGKAGSYTVTLTVTDEQNAQGIATAPVTITATVPPKPPPGPVVIANDSFEDDGPGTSWNYMSLLGTFDPKVPVVESGGVLTITPRASFSGQHYNGYLGTRRLDFTGTSAQIEVKEITKGNGNSQFALCLDNQNFYLMETEENMLFCTEVINGQRNQAGAAYNGTAHRFWRMRHVAATDRIVFETSTDDKTWSERRSLARKLPLTAMAVQLSAGTWSALKDPGKTVFDNFRMER